MKQKPPLPGYPVTKAFQTKEELDSYLNAPLIKCLLCGRDLKTLHRHIESAIHKVSHDEYHLMYGIPWGRALCCPDTLKKQSDRLIRRRALGEMNSFVPEDAKLKARASKGRPLQPSTIKNTQDRMRITLSKKEEINGVLLSHEEISKIADIDRKTISARVRRGYTGEDLLKKINTLSGSSINRYQKIPIDGVPRSVHEIAKISGASRTVIWRRIRQNATGNELIKKPIRQPRKIKIDGVIRSYAEIAEIAGMTVTGIANRIKNGVTGKDLFKKKEDTFKNIPINDGWYSVDEIAKITGMTKSGIKQRIRNGRTGEELLKKK